MQGHRGILKEAEGSGTSSNSLPALSDAGRRPTLSDLAAMRSNRLEPLRGDRAGQYSIRVNDQWRICFVWRGNDTWDVEIMDYH